MTDTETQKVLTDGQKAEQLISSDEWKWAKKKFFEKMFACDSISALKDLDKMSDMELARMIRNREKLINMLLEWLNEIEGLSSQAASNREAFTRQREEIILNYDNQ